MMIDSTKTRGPAMAPTSPQPSDDNVIYANNDWRVISSPCGSCWIVQKAEIRAAGRLWVDKTEQTTRKALIRQWHARTGDYSGAVALGRLPKQIGGANGT